MEIIIIDKGMNLLFFSKPQLPIEKPFQKLLIQNYSNAILI